MRHKPHVVVVGAGAFGGWTALRLIEKEARVTLLDTWGPANSRASSGGESRIIRGTYGPKSIYTEMTARAFRLWESYERLWRMQLVHRSGVLWMTAVGEDSFERGSIAMLRAAKIKHEELSARELKKRWPQINLAGVHYGIFEPESGYLLARQIGPRVVEAFQSLGGEYRQIAVQPEGLESGTWKALRLADGSSLVADSYVFACGPWLGHIFPKTVGRHVRPTKQDMFFFGTPPGDHRFDCEHMPVWAEHRDRFRYGIPANHGKGFKIADDTRGPTFDPTNGERTVSLEKLRAIREYLAVRFPGMRAAPLVEARVCQYEQSPDSHLIMDRHPIAHHVWLLGGGSGHGYKHGPLVGEIMADLVLNDGEPAATFRLARLTGRPTQLPAAASASLQRDPRLECW
jgi:glycine/D-amino acid oxidase-like deaminating enzyme